MRVHTCVNFTQQRCTCLLAQAYMSPPACRKHTHAPSVPSHASPTTPSLTAYPGKSVAAAMHLCRATTAARPAAPNRARAVKAHCAALEKFIILRDAAVARRGRGLNLGMKMPGPSLAAAAPAEMLPQPTVHLVELRCVCVCGGVSVACMHAWGVAGGCSPTSMELTSARDTRARACTHTHTRAHGTYIQYVCMLACTQPTAGSMHNSQHTTDRNPCCHTVAPRLLFHAGGCPYPHPPTTNHN